MYNYSFRPTFPVYYRSAQVLLTLGLTLAAVSVYQLWIAKLGAYDVLPLVTLSLTSFFGFIVQYVRFQERRERGYFMVVDLEGFHSYGGRNRDTQMNWSSVQSMDRAYHTLIVSDHQNREHRLYLGDYQRIDRLRIECLMHQFFMHYSESLKPAAQIKKLVSVA